MSISLTYDPDDTCLPSVLGGVAAASADGVVRFGLGTRDLGPGTLEFPLLS
jgi:hypothetical protein